MLSKQALRQRSSQAAKLKAEQLRLETEQLRLSQVAQRLAEEREKELEAERQRSRLVARSKANEVFRQVVRAANEGHQATDYFVSPDISKLLEEELKADGLAHTVKRTSDVEVEANERLKPLITMLELARDRTRRAEYHLRQLAAATPHCPAPDGTKYFAEPILEVLDELDKECPGLLDETETTYYRRNLQAYLEERRKPKPLDRLSLHWKPIELTEQLVNCKGRVPGWLLTTGGRGLMQRIGECAAQEADAERTQVIFALETLPVNKARWGKNVMTMFVYGDQPIGVTPLSDAMMQDVFRALGFRTQLKVTEARRTLTVAW